MKRLEQDPRIVNGPGLFASVLDWARRVTVAINTNVDELLGFTVARSGTSGTVATIEPVNGGNGDARLVLNKVGTQNAVITASKSGLKRWEIVMANAVAESGGNAGSDFGIDRYNDAGAGIATAISFRRSDGLCTIPGQINAGSSINATGNVSAPTFMGSGVQAIGWSSVVTGGGESYEMLAYSPTGSGSGGVNHCRSYHLHGVWAGWQFVCQGTGVFDMRGNGTGYSVGGWVATSDGSVKRNRAAITGLQQRAHLAPAYAYDRTDMLEFDGSMCRRVGIIAEQFEAVEPLVVFRDPPTEKNPEPLRSVDYNGVAALAWQLGIDNFETIKTLRAQIIQLRNEIEILKGN